MTRPTTATTIDNKEGTNMMTEHTTEHSDDAGTLRRVSVHQNSEPGAPRFAFAVLPKSGGGAGAALLWFGPVFVRASVAGALYRSLRARSHSGGAVFGRFS